MSDNASSNRVERDWMGDPEPVSQTIDPQDYPHATRNRVPSWRLAIWAHALDQALNAGEPTEDQIESLRNLLKWLEEQRGR